jgi:broad specificity phosphatase PhoE
VTPPHDNVIFLVRHGETEWNRERRVQGRLDSPLTALGREQAVCAGRLIRSVVPDPLALHVVSSPLGRARETARLLCDSAGIPASFVATDLRLAEVSTGAWDGLLYDEVERLAPGVVASHPHHGWYLHSPDGERYEEVAARVSSWLESVKARPAVVAVTHGIVSRVLRGLYAGLAPDETLRLPLPQDSVFVLARGSVQVLTEAPLD